MPNRARRSAAWRWWTSSVSRTARWSSTGMSCSRSRRSRPTKTPCSEPGTRSKKEVHEVGSRVEREPVGAEQPWPGPRQAWYAVTIFALSLMINFLDRGIVSLLVGPIKRDLHLSDFEMSLITGFAFVLLYLLLGLPIARLVDRATRRTILACGITAWGVAT